MADRKKYIQQNVSLTDEEYENFKVLKTNGWKPKQVWTLGIMQASKLAQAIIDAENEKLKSSTEAH